MKKTLVIIGTAFTLVGAAIAGWVAYLPVSIDVGVSSLQILPAVTPYADAWETNTAYVYGDYVSWSNREYWCVSAGTSKTTYATAPTATDGDDTNDAPIVWRYIHPRRSQVYIVNDGTAPVYLSFKTAATASSGIRLNANGGAFSSPSGSDCPQGAIYAISEAGSTNTLLIQER